MRYLAGRGVDRSRLQSRGYGSAVPVATNRTEEGRAQNRRVEFRIVQRGGLTAD
jgi:outer membrane protein OmpA-like peptidoglycan-associated protein